MSPIVTMQRARCGPGPTVAGVAQYWEANKPGGLTLWEDNQFEGMGRHGSWTSDGPDLHISPCGWALYSPGAIDNSTDATDPAAPFPGNVWSIHYPANSPTTNSMGKLVTLGDFNNTQPEHWRSKYQCMMVRFKGVGGNFCFGDSSATKFLYDGIHTIGSGHEGSIPIEPDWSSVGGTDNGGIFGLTATHQSGGPGSSYGLPYNGDGIIVTEEWQCLEYFIRTSDIGESNGIIWVKVNGLTVIEYDDIDFTTNDGGQTYIDGVCIETNRNGNGSNHYTPSGGQSLDFNRMSVHYSNS